MIMDRQGFVQDIEFALLKGVTPMIDSSDFEREANARELLKYASEGQFEQALSSILPRCILSDIKNTTPVDQIVDIIQTCVKSYVSSGGSESWRQLEILLAAICSLQLFVQNNWTGPPTNKDPVQFLPYEESEFEKIKYHVLDSLQVDGESAYPLARFPLYLLIAKTLLQDCRESMSGCISNDWWLFRCLVTHQKLLQERSPTLKTAVVDLIDSVSKNDTLLENNENRLLKMQFYMEAHAASMFYFENTKAKQLIEVVQKGSGLQIELTGALGKRSRYQKEDQAELILKVSRQSEAGDSRDSERAEETMSKEIETGGNGDREKAKETASAAESGKEPEKIMPKDISLNDDTFLNHIEFTDENNPLNYSVSAVEQAIVLSVCLDMRYNNPAHERLTDVATLAFIHTLLHLPQDWCVQTVALNMRSQLEKDSRRRVERSMMQLEELVKQFDRPEPDGRTRLSLVYCTNLPPKWKIQEDLGDFFVSLGCISSAMETFEKVENWDKLIVCYVQLEKKDKAEKVIRERLAVKETPDLWCYLGDVLQDEQYYNKAWELSNHRSGRSQKLLGFLYLRTGKYKECIECFEKSLSINYLQIPVWYSCGCACLLVQDFKKAANAFRNCVTLESDNFEAWNNLSLAYIRSGQKERAFRTLQEAVKCDYNNWRIWENILITAADVGEFTHLIRAYHRLLDIRDKHEDPLVLEILVKAINQDLSDAQDKPASKLRSKALELFGRITSKVTNSASIWHSYSELVKGQENLSLEDEEKALQHLQKSHRCLTLVANWEKEVSKCEKICKRSIQLAEAYTSYCEKCGNTATAIQTASACKLMLRGVLSKIKQKQSTSAESVVPELQEDYNKLEEHLQETEQLLTRLKSAS
ncbi:tetratricopeptide repeat protein 27 [Lingula anatina]|uniref:Tetratricopeptide repeat protein 27 n=1 Tax=Lingula anatina TaxID=7574 RepID=A0A1S3KDD0_LINAN|nr:tetratricopeptide repeat protein 27 [Lingula anatina]|eukprot:XP_013420464.1 tetratricopeptide repeat protein 27 [Lingula anatina]